MPMGICPGSYEFDTIQDCQSRSVLLRRKGTQQLQGFEELGVLTLQKFLWF